MTFNKKYEALSGARRERIRSARLRQPIKELARKRDKAMRRSIWTQEDIDHADAFAEVMLQKLNNTQCDGCKRGLRIIGGIHTEPKGNPGVDSSNLT